MSGTENRNWSAAFAPPPPPPLPSRTTPALDESNESAAQTKAGQGRRLAPVPTTQTTPAGDQSAPRPDPHEARPSTGEGGPEQVTAPETRSERDQASQLVAAIADAGLEAHLIGVRRSPAGPAFDVELGTVDAVQSVVLMAEELTAALGAEQVRVSRRDSETVVRIDVLRGTALDERGRQMAVWVPVEVRDAVNTEKDRTQETFTEFFLGAFNRQYATLDGLFPQRLASPGPMPQKKARKRRGIVTPVQLWLYLNAEQREVLDEAVERSGAGSRSALVTRLLESDLSLTLSR